MKSAPRILSVEDDPDIGELLGFQLRAEGFEFCLEPHGSKALQRAQDFRPDLVLLDVMLPGMSGFEICRLMRRDESLSSVPIILLTARGAEDDVVKGLEAGADDYVAKPFSVRVLIAKVRRALHRTHPLEKEMQSIEIMDISIDPLRHQVKCAGEDVELTSSEFRTLHFLATRPGWVFTRHQIMAAVHGEGYVVSERSIDVMIVGLRKKLGISGKCIETVRGVGYRFAD